jgi:hypothetical protein
MFIFVIDQELWVCELMYHIIDCDHSLGRKDILKPHLTRRNISDLGLNHLERFQMGKKLKHFRGESVWNISCFCTAIMKQQNRRFKWFWFTSFSFSLNPKHFNKWFHKVILIRPRINSQEKLKYFCLLVNLELYQTHS